MLQDKHIVKKKSKRFGLVPPLPFWSRLILIGFGAQLAFMQLDTMLQVVSHGYVPMFGRIFSNINNINKIIQRISLFPHIFSSFLFLGSRCLGFKLTPGHRFSVPLSLRPSVRTFGGPIMGQFKYLGGVRAGNSSAETSFHSVVFSLYKRYANYI